MESSDRAKPLPRRCVICGIEREEVDDNGKINYHYPKNKDEARIWQRSMAANDVCIDSIQEQCCVCIEHIPEFVGRAQRQCAKFKANEEADAELREQLQFNAGVDSCRCPDGEGHGMNRPSVNVLLLSGATLPSYCGKAFTKSCDPAENEGGGEQPSEDNEDDGIKRESESDTEIFVLESDFKDSGATFPDIDGTEVTVLRTPTQDDNELNQIAEEYDDDEETCLGHRDTCMPGCTDVLLLGRGLHPTDVCPCECEQCAKKPTAALDEEKVCCKPPCCPEPAPPEYFDQPPCGCECEQQVRRELGRVIKKQKNRIRELEELLCRQHKLHHCLQTKVDELYCEFGRVDEEDKTRQLCFTREEPNCAEVIQAKSEVIHQRQSHQSGRTYSGTSYPGTGHSRKPRKSIGSMSESEAETTYQEDEYVPNRVHLYSTKNPDYKRTFRTRYPAWVTTIKSSDSADSIRSDRKKMRLLVRQSSARVTYTPTRSEISTESELRRPSILAKRKTIEP